MNDLINTQNWTQGEVDSGLLQRKAEILALLQREAPRAARRRKRKKVVMVSAYAQAILTVSSVVGVLTLQRGATLTNPAPIAISPSRVHIEVVSDRVDPATVAMSDDELLTALACMGRPTGLARIGDRVVLTKPVTDAELRRLRESTPEKHTDKENTHGAAAM